MANHSRPKDSEPITKRYCRHALENHVIIDQDAIGFLLLLIGWVDGEVFLNQSRGVVGQNQSNLLRRAIENCSKYW